MNKPRKKKSESIEEYNMRISKLYYSNGYNIKEIADRLKIDEIEVYNYVTKGNKITTKSERSEMIRLRDSGMSYEDIGRMLNRDHSCIIRRVLQPAKTNCESNNYLTDTQIKKMKNMAINKVRISDIAKELGVSQSSIRYRLSHCDFVNISNRVTEKEIKRFIRLYKNGKTHKEIAKKCGRSIKTVGKYLRAAGYYRSKEK